MDPCYDLVNECLRMLSTCGMSHRRKLQVETELLKVKVVLLACHPPVPVDRFEPACAKIRNKMENTCELNLDGEIEVVKELSKLIKELIVIVGAKQKI